MEGRSRRPPSWTRPAAVSVLGTTTAALPAFLTGAVAVQIRDDLGVTEAAIGLAIGAFFVGSALGSAALGRLAERLGPVAAIRSGLLATAVTDLAVVALAVGSRSLAAVLVLAGASNALGQPAANLLVVRTVDRRRLGLVMALKQSGMPAAALLGGLAVPIVALTIGWRAAYLIGAGLAVAATLLTVGLKVGSGIPGPVVAVGERATPAARSGGTPGSPSVRAAIAVPDQPRSVLVLMAGVGVLGGGAANIVVGYLVSGAVDAGIGPGPAGLVLSAGSGLGICSRLVHGWLADRGDLDALHRVVVLLTTGLGGALLLASHRPAAYLLAAPLVFAGGWAWPGLFNLVVVQSNRSAPAAATGVTQTGVYVGSVLGPVLAGLLIQHLGYGTAWVLTAGALGGAAALALAVRRALSGVEPAAVGG